MSDLGDAIGAAGEGTLLARAIEPPHGEACGHTGEAACLNCGTPLLGAYCHACGQRGHVHRTLSAFFHDLLHGVLHFEGKTWRTLPLLVWKPGKLTREYIDGRRARYVSPIALFLFVVFLSFAAFSLLGAGGAVQTPADGLEAARQAYQNNAERLAALEREQAGLAPSDRGRRNEIKVEMDELRDDQQGLRLVLGNVGSSAGRQFSEGFSENPLPSDSALAKALQHLRDNPQLAIYKLQTNAYKFSWMLIPLSVPFVWLMFPFNRRFGGYDHTVFTTYSITFMIALVAVSSLLFYLDAGGVAGLLLLYAPYHMYRQLRGTYGVGRWGALWRMLALSMFAWVAIGLFAAAIGAMAA